MSCNKSFFCWSGKLHFIVCIKKQQSFRKEFLWYSFFVCLQVTFHPQGAPSAILNKHVISNLYRITCDIYRIDRCFDTDVTLWPDTTYFPIKLSWTPKKKKKKYFFKKINSRTFQIFIYFSPKKVQSPTVT